jgi:hypothetical protein
VVLIMANVAYWVGDDGKVVVASFSPGVEPTAEVLAVIVPPGTTAHVIDAGLLPTVPPEYWTVAADGTITFVTPPAPISPEAVANYRALIERRADRLQKNGDDLGAIKLLMTL